MWPLTRFQIYLDALADGAGGGGSPSPAPSPSPSPSPSPAPAASGTPGGGARAADSTAGRPPTAEPDRSTWIPPYRLQELQRTHRAELDRLTGQHRSLEQRVRALMGVAEPEDPKSLEVRKAFGDMFPHLKPLLDRPDAAGKLVKFLESGQLDELGQSSSMGWRRHAYTVVKSAAEQYAQAIGVKASELPAGSVNRLARELQAYIQADRTGDRNQRYEMGDPGIVDEFVKDLVGFYVEPVRGRMTAAAAQQARRAQALPTTERRSAAPPASADPAPAAGRFASKKERFAAMREALLSGQGAG